MEVIRSKVDMGVGGQLRYQFSGLDGGEAEGFGVL